MFLDDLLIVYDLFKQNVTSTFLCLAIICRGPGLRLRGFPKRCEFNISSPCRSIPAFYVTFKTSGVVSSPCLIGIPVTRISYFEPLSLILSVQNTQHNIVLQIINNNKVSDTMVDVNC